MDSRKSELAATLFGAIGLREPLDREFHGCSLDPVAADSGFTVAGLFAFLPPFGAMGAAVVSLIAYTTNYVVLALAASRRLRLPVLSIIVPRRSDAQWLRQLVLERTRKVFKRSTTVPGQPD